MRLHRCMIQETTTVVGTKAGMVTVSHDAPLPQTPDGHDWMRELMNTTLRQQVRSNPTHCSLLLLLLSPPAQRKLALDTPLLVLGPTEAKVKSSACSSDWARSFRSAARLHNDPDGPAVNCQGSRR